MLYFWDSNLYSRFLSLLFGICYQLCTFKNPIFSTHFYLGQRSLVWLFSPPLDSPSSPGRLYLPPPPFLLYPTLWISLCVPGCGEHLGKGLLAGSVSLLLIPPFILLDTSVSFLPLLFSSLCNSVNISEGSRLWRAKGSDYWLACSLPIWFPLFSSWSPLSPSSLFSSPCNSVYLSGCPSLWRNFSSLT